jgi:hypothetical protein
MPSPFPGMDPFLEEDRLWAAFQDAFASALSEVLQQKLREKYRIGISERTYSNAHGGTQRESFVEVYGHEHGRRLVLIDIASPANKTTQEGRAAYLTTRQRARMANVVTVDIDLLQRGTPTLNYSRDKLPPFDYAVTVSDNSTPPRNAMYTSHVLKRLPRFTMPLGVNGATLVLDLQAVFEKAYELGGFATLIDYAVDPATSETEPRHSQIDQLLLEKGLREASKPVAEAVSHSTEAPSDDHVALAAYYLWQRDGSPEGRHEEYWQRAREQLKQTQSTVETP